MQALTTAVFPDYFRQRTYAMGNYYGVLIEGSPGGDGGLVLPGPREISSICTYPEHQGKGLAAMLTRYLVGNILRDDRQPFRHVGT